MKNGGADTSIDAASPIASMSGEKITSNAEGEEASRLGNSSGSHSRSVSGVEILLQLLEEKKGVWHTSVRKRLEQEERGTMLFYKMMKEGANKQQVAELAKTMTTEGEGQEGNSLLPRSDLPSAGSDTTAAENFNIFEEKSKLMPSAQAFFKKDGGSRQDSSENLRLSFLKDAEVMLPIPPKIARWDGTTVVSPRSHTSWEEALLVVLRILANCSSDSASPSLSHTPSNWFRLLCTQAIVFQVM